MKMLTMTGAVVALLTTVPVPAAHVTLEDEDRGWYNDGGATELPNTNYIAGECTEQACTQHSEYRNFFLFDLSGIDRTIANASLRLWLPSDGFSSPTGNELYELFDVVTDLDELGQRWGVDIFDDLGTGTSYGTFTATEADEQTLIEISLNDAAVAGLNAADGLFALGGAVTSLDDLINDEIVFSGTGAAHAYLVLETVPLPGAAWLLASALLMLGYRRGLP